MSDDQVKELARAILAIAHGGLSGPTGLEGLAMSICGEGNPPGRQDSVASGLHDIADSIRDLAEAAAAWGANQKSVSAEWCQDCLKATGIDGHATESPKAQEEPSQIVEDAIRNIVREEIEAAKE